MNLFHYFVILTIILVFVTALLMARTYKNKLRAMSDMIISMAIGTNIGLTTGVLLGSLYQGNLYYSTIYSVLTGVLAGAIIGVFFGVLPLLEGFMGGLMGGMMGAMLGEMITEGQSIMTMNLFLTLSVSTLFLFPILSVPSNYNEKMITKKWILKPLLIMFLLASYLLLGNQVSKVTFSKPIFPEEQRHENHHKELLK